MPQAVIFDLDGTLLESMSVWQNELHQFLTEQGITPPAELINITKTLGTAQAIAYIVQEFHLPLSADEAYDIFLARMTIRYETDLALKPYARDYLNYLAKCAIPMSIATATPYPLAHAAIERLGLSPLFEHIITVADVGVGKHDPAIYLQSAARLGFAPNQCCVFEDSLQALKTARTAGFHTVAVDEATAILEKDAILQIAERYIYSFSELL